MKSGDYKKQTNTNLNIGYSNDVCTALLRFRKGQFKKCITYMKS
jgi:hypothetical protein